MKLITGKMAVKKKTTPKSSKAPKKGVASTGQAPKSGGATTGQAVKDKYFEGVGRRKTAVARVRFYPGQAGFIVNGTDVKSYFPNLRFEKSAEAPLKSSGAKGGVEVRAYGGGVMAQSEAVTLGLARALVKFNLDFKKEFRTLGYLTRDSRMVERKKFGLKKARRAPQWRKR